VELEADPKDWTVVEDPESEAEEAERYWHQVASDRERDPGPDSDVRAPYVFHSQGKRPCVLG
jgi:hypothetical protein